MNTLASLSLSKKEISDLNAEIDKLEKELGKDIDFGSRRFDGIPKHVAVIADGNRTWGKKHGLDAIEAHNEAAKHVIRLLHRASEMGIESFTVWAGDTKNLQKRGKAEAKNLVKLVLLYAMLFKRRYLDKDIRFRHMGARNLLPKRVQKILKELEAETRFKKTTVFNLAFNYGGRDELVRVMRKLLKDKVNPNDVTEELVSSLLDTNEVGDPDMIIRTGGQLRLSGFMPWQSAPSELFFTDKLFPEFSADDFEAMVKEFPKRERKLGA